MCLTPWNRAEDIDEENIKEKKKILLLCDIRGYPFVFSFRWIWRVKCKGHSITCVLTEYEWYLAGYWPLLSQSPFNPILISNILLGIGRYLLCFIMISDHAFIFSIKLHLFSNSYYLYSYISEHDLKNWFNFLTIKIIMTLSIIWYKNYECKIRWY